MATSEEVKGQESASGCFLTLRGCLTGNLGNRPCPSLPVQRGRSQTVHTRQGRAAIGQAGSGRWIVFFASTTAPGQKKQKTGGGISGPVPVDRYQWTTGPVWYQWTGH